MPTTSLNSIPVDLADNIVAPDSPADVTDIVYPDGKLPEEKKLVDFVVGWRRKLQTARLEKLNIWNECWQLYRGLEDWSSKEDWQSKIVLPKAFATVKQAVNVMRRLMRASRNPWMHEPYNPEDLVQVIRGEKMSDLSRAFLDRARYLEHFFEGLEIGFITGLSVWKVWWGLVPRTRVRVQTSQIPVEPSLPGANGFSPLMASVPYQRNPDFSNPTPLGQGPFDLIKQQDTLYRNQLPNEDLAPLGGEFDPSGANLPFQVQKQIIKEEMLEGQLFIRAVDPYNFYWLPGSKLNDWRGTIEDISMPKWELTELAKTGIFGPDGEQKVKDIKPMKMDETTQQTMLRFSERPISLGDQDTDNVKLTEYYGPVICEGEMIARHGHLLIANDSTVLIAKHNPAWNKKEPYVGFSPLKLPLRTDGVGLLEMVREIHRALSRLANMSIDTLMFQLMPLFEVNIGAFENPEDFETGMVPGKIFKRNPSFVGQEGIKPIINPGISAGAMQTEGMLDRSYQEGAFVSEIQQGIPRFRGQQSATEIEAKNENQNSFMGSMAADIEEQALLPIVDLATDLILQFIDTANDPRVASILGVDAGVIAGMTREELMEMIQGDYTIKVTGMTAQLQKAEMLQNLVQVMNIIGQNPEAWLPYLQQDELLRRILEAFRPAIHDIEKIIADPATAAAAKAANESKGMSMEMLRMIPQLAEQAHRMQQEQQKLAQEQAAAQQQQIAQALQLEQAGAELEHTKAQAAHENALAAADLVLRNKELSRSLPPSEKKAA